MVWRAQARRCAGTAWNSRRRRPASGAV